MAAARRGKPSPRRGITMSEEQKRKISIARTGKALGHVVTEETRQKISAGNMGKTYTPEQLARMSAGQRRRFSDPAERARLSAIRKAQNWHPTAEQTRKQVAIQTGRPNGVLGYKWTPEQRQHKRDTAMRGPKHYKWKGGITPENHKIRNSYEYKEWRTAVFTRDNHTCQACGARSAKGKPVTLHSHHIQPFAEHPELRFAVGNGVTLCDGCHDAAHGKGLALGAGCATVGA